MIKGTAILTIVLLVSSIAVYADHQYRSEWETHGGNDNTGGLRAFIKVQSPDISSCSNLSLPCTHSMVYATQADAGYIGAGWIKFKNAAGNMLLYGVVHWRDYKTGEAWYILTKGLNSKIGSSPLFQAKKQNYDANNSCWYGVTDGWVESHCFVDFSWGHPRVVGRLNNNQVTFGTSIGEFTNVQNRDRTSNTWTNMGSSSFLNYCADTSYTDIHGHNDINGFYAFHISPPTQSGETYNCSSAGTPFDLGG